MKKKHVRVGSSWKIVRWNVNGLTIPEDWVDGELYVYGKTVLGRWRVVIYKSPNQDTEEVNKHRLQDVEDEIFQLYMEEVTPLQMKRVVIE